MTRSELYALVWQRPMIHVAKDYGLSDVGLRKICVKYGIPTPPLGYWAKLAHGKAVTRPPLPVADKGIDAEIALVEHAAVDAPQEVIDALQRAGEFESKADNKIVVPAQRPRKLTPVAVVFAKALQGCHPNRNDFVCLGSYFAPTVQVSTSLIARVVVLVDALAQAQERRGGSLQLLKEDLVITVDGETFELRLRETPSKQEHILTKEELKQKAEHEERCRRYPGIYSERTNLPKWDYTSSGRVNIQATDSSLYSWKDGHLVGRWRDRKDRRVEDQLGDLMVSLAGAAARAKIRRQVELDKLRLEAEAENERRAEEARRKRHNKRREFLLKAARRYRQYQALVALRDHLTPKTAPDRNEPLNKMTGVLGDLVAEMANRFERESLNDEIVKLGLIADDDIL